MKQLNSAKGFTLVEVMVGVALMGLTSFVVLSSFHNTAKMQLKSQAAMEQRIDTLTGENLLFVDLKNIDPSFNLLEQKDDRSQRFFDYYPDVPIKFIQGNSGRIITLSQQASRELFFLETYPLGGPMFLYDPVMAYSVGAPPADMNTAATLNFVSLNQNSLLATQRPLMWQNNRYVLLDTPARLRPAPNGVIDMSVAPRSPAFLGYVSDQQLLESTIVQTRIMRTHPISGVLLDSADKFLRLLPAAGGGVPLVRLRPVRLLKYSFEPLSGNQGWGLFRSILKGDQFESRVLVADQLESVTFMRRSINDKLIEFVITKKESKPGEQK